MQIPNVLEDAPLEKIRDTAYAVIEEYQRILTDRVPAKESIVDAVWSHLFSFGLAAAILVAGYNS